MELKMLKSLGLVRKVDDLGRIVIPMELRRVLGIDKQTPMEIFADENRIILQKYAHTCAVTGVTGDLVELPNGKFVSKDVVDMIKEASKDS